MDHFGVYEVLDRATCQISDVFAGEDHELFLTITHSPLACTPEWQATGLWPMETGGCIDAIGSESEPFDVFAANQVLVNDCGRIFGLNVAVPDSFGIDDNHWAVLALVEAARFIDTHGAA